MSVTLIPDGEQIVGAYLRETDEMQALDARVAGRTPSGMTDPWIRLTQLDAPDDPQTGVEHLIGFYFQLDCYAGDGAMADHEGQAEAWLLARTARALLKALPRTVHDDVVFTDVRFPSMARIPDTTTGEPARERVILTATVLMHPR